MRFEYPEIDPIIFSFSIGNFELALRWYALSYILGILIAWKLMQIFSKNSALWPNSVAPIKPAAVEDLMTIWHEKKDQFTKLGRPHCSCLTSWIVLWKAS